MKLKASDLVHTNHFVPHIVPLEGGIQPGVMNVVVGYGTTTPERLKRRVDAYFASMRRLRP
jgi:hypothetical protein